uniref:Reverse transcriptase RNase H-like domain-containing protein n=1 Tax=Amphimedon queenslandica TaxID=400682 RepID=A0A1X7SIY1_AMPQE
DVRAFLGLAGYYRKFIPNFASIAVALTDCTKKAAPTTVQWDTHCNTAFITLKELLCRAPVLNSPDFNRPFILQTDASDRGVGAVLSQLDDSGQEHPVAYFSKKLLPREEKYSTIEKECLAIKLGVKAFQVYLLGKQFQIQTDHRALVWLNNMKDKTSRLTRWSLALQPFDFTIVHRVGKANVNADALSRAPSSTST